MEQWSDPGSGIKHPGSATLVETLFLQRKAELFFSGQRGQISNFFDDVG
jgi:hypothetical protein